MSDPLGRAEGFLRRCVRRGLAHSYDARSGSWVKPYPEVTGYLLSYFCEAGELPPEMLRATRRLRRLQRPSGGFPSWRGGGRLFSFDTAQILHGFASVYRRTRDPRLLNAALRCAAFLERLTLPDGSVFPIYQERMESAFVDQGGDWAERFSPIQTKAVEGLVLLARITGNGRHRAHADALARFGRAHCDLTYTHPGAYCLEGLLAHGDADFVRHRLEAEVLPRVRPNGFIPYAEGLDYAYVSGSVQLGLLLLEHGFSDEAGAILHWARRVQQASDTGGLFQYAREDSNPDETVHSEINSWGTKYFCQLERRWSALDKP